MEQSIEIIFQYGIYTSDFTTFEVLGIERS